MRQLENSLKKLELKCFNSRIAGVIVYLVVVSSSSFAVRVTCEYKYITWPVLGNSYTCQIRNFNETLQNQSLSKVSGSHLSRLSDLNVRAFDISGQTCNYLPQRIKNFFPNIELLQVWKSKLKALSKDDLEPFKKLQVLHMHANNLESLESDLFEFNTQLVRIDFRHQNLLKIGYRIFDNLSLLKLADFQSSGCVDFYGQNGHQGMEDLRTAIRINCSPIEEMMISLAVMKKKIEEFEAKSSLNEGKSIKVDHEESPLMKKLEVKFAQMLEENAKCVENLNVVTKNYLTLIEKVDTIDKSLKSENPPNNCSLAIEQNVCLLNKEIDRRIKRDLSAIDLQCVGVEWMGSACNARNLKIVHDDVEIRKVFNGKQEVSSSNFNELRVYNEQVLFLPLNLGKVFKNLKDLSFIKCELFTLDGKSSAFSAMKNLQRLTLSYNKLQKITEDVFKELSGLTSLDLSFNKINYIGNEAFQSIRTLKELKLNDNLLIELTTSICKNLENLKFIFLQNNRLSVIPSDLLTPMKKLEFADFSNNKCIKLAASKTSVVTLKDLETDFADNCSKF